MTTTEQLRTALREVEPGWQAVDVEAVRRRARRVRRRRRTTCVVAALSVLALAFAAGPVALSRSATHQRPASLQANKQIPTTVAEARAVATLSRRTTALPVITRPGEPVALPNPLFGEYHVAPPLPGETGPGRLCGMHSVPEDCQRIVRTADGWLTKYRIALATEGPASPNAAIYLVIDAPVANVVAVADGKPIPGALRELGQGYLLWAGSPPVRGTRSFAVEMPIEVWAFDGQGSLVARTKVA